MLPNFLFPETEVQKDSEGAALPLDDAAGRTLQITLGITETVEQASLDLHVFSSTDGVEWSGKPLFSFPQKFYKGSYTILLDLTEQPDIRFLKVKYKTARWGHWTTPAVFKMYVFVEVLAA